MSPAMNAGYCFLYPLSGQIGSPKHTHCVSAYQVWRVWGINAGGRQRVAGERLVTMHHLINVMHSPRCGPCHQILGFLHPSPK